MISIVTWLWRGDDPRRVFLPEHVTTLAGTFRRTLSIPHRFICISDDTSGFGAGVEVIQTPVAAAKLGQIKSPEGARFPSCYRRLWCWSDEAKMLGEKIFVIDVDLLVLKDLASVIERPEDFVGWRPLAHWGNRSRIGGGMYLLKTGSHTHVYDSFHGQPSIMEARKAGYRGSDQAWLSYKVGRTAKVWPDNIGIYSIRDMDNGRKPLPADARAVQFNGPTKMWHSSLPWVKEHWR